MESNDRAGFNAKSDAELRNKIVLNYSSNFNETSNKNHAML